MSYRAAGFMYAPLRESDVISLDQIENDERTKALFTRLKALEDCFTMPPDVNAMAHECLQKACDLIFKTLLKLPHLENERGQGAFRMHYGLDDFSFEKRRLRVVGAQFLITREGVRQIVIRVWQKLEQEGIRRDDVLIGKQFYRLHYLEELTGELAADVLRRMRRNIRKSLRQRVFRATTSW